MTSATGSDLIELTIERVAHGGSCVAHLDGRVVFVRHTLPGERVLARVTEDRGRYLRADAVEVLEPSIDRVDPPCPYAGPGKCGGCDWQHVDVAAQRVLKAKIVREQFRRLANTEVGVRIEALPAVEGAGPGLGWRTRVTFSVTPDGVVGLRRHRSLDIEPVTECLIAHPAVTAVGVERRRWPGTFAVEVIASESSGDRALVVTPAHRGDDVTVPPLDASASVMRGDGRGHVTPVRGRPGVREKVLERTWRVTGSGFWQVHPHAAATLADAVLAELDPQPGESALDLYCGVGLFAGALASRVGPTGWITAIEGDEQAAEDARHNLGDVAQVRVESGDVADVLTRLGVRRADVVVLDPPRVGAGADVVRRLASLDCRRIAYVACDPAALARDVATFAECGWDMRTLRAFDLFPMTAHVECLAVLEPRAGRQR